MNDRNPQPTSKAVDLAFADFRLMRQGLAERVHQMTGDDRRAVRDALMAVVFEIDEVEQRMRARFGAPAEPGSVTADVLRRLRKNRGAHRSTP